MFGFNECRIVADWSIENMSLVSGSSPILCYGGSKWQKVDSSANEVEGSLAGFKWEGWSYRITVVMKVEADINASITASVLEQAAISEIMDVKTFKTDVLVFIGNTISLESH